MGENKSKILLLLEEADWPIKQQDVALLIKEITRAEKFINQSQSLRKAATGEDFNDEDDSDQEKVDSDDDDNNEKIDDDFKKNEKDYDDSSPERPPSDRSDRSNRSLSIKSRNSSPPRSETNDLKDNEGL